MTKGTKTFRIIISVLLALSIIFSAFFAALFCLYISKDVMEEEYGIYVAGIPVTRGNGAVFYDHINNILVFDNATIEFEYTTVYSSIDLTIELIGDNKFVSTNNEYCIGIFSGDNHLGKDLAITGEGSLTIELPNKSAEAVGIYASDLIALADITVITPDCDNQVNGIVCTSSLLIGSKATVTVNGGAAKYSSALRVRGNAFLEEGTALNVTANPGTSNICKGLSVSGDLILGKDTILNVSIDDSAINLGECIRISGFMDIGIGSKVTASAKNAYAIECFGTIEANNGATVTGDSENKDTDIFCSGSIVNRGAKFTGKIDAIGGVHNKSDK